MSKSNISPEIEAAIREGREMGLCEAAAFVAGLKEEFVPWLLRGLGGVPEVGPDGWGQMSDDKLKTLAGASRGILRLINGEPHPGDKHEHRWSTGRDPVCAICGHKRRALLAEALLAA